jgi:hypothetical protein
MPDPDLDQVDRDIKEAKELAEEVRQPGVDTGAVDAPEPVQDESEEGFTPS